MNSAFGRYVLAWEQQRCDEAVSDIFGQHSVQLGMPVLQGLRANRMPRRWLALPPADWTRDLVGCQDLGAAHLACHPEALPFPEASVDLLVLPHTLERCMDPHAALREVERVLRPEGRVLIFGFNPLSLWGLQHALERPKPPRPDASGGLAYWRLRDWLHLLAMDIVATDFGCHVPAVEQDVWLERWRWMDTVGQRAWPVLGSAYCVLAVKKVAGVRMLSPGWRARTAAPNGAAAAARQQAPQRNEV